MHTDMPKTINEALKILAYNDYFWSDPLSTQKTQIKPHPKDYDTVRSRLRHSEILGRITVCLDREAGKISSRDIEKISNQVPGTRNGHQEIVRQSCVRR